jgi:hypothetical protein
MKITAEQRDRLSYLMSKKKVSRAEVAAKMKLTEIYFSKYLLTEKHMTNTLWNKLVYLLNKKYEYRSLKNFVFEREKGKIHFDLINVVDKVNPVTLEKYEMLGYWFKNLKDGETETFDQYWRRISEKEIKDFVLNYLNSRG